MPESNRKAIHEKVIELRKSGVEPKGTCHFGFSGDDEKICAGKETGWSLYVMAPRKN